MKMLILVFYFILSVKCYCLLAIITCLSRGRKADKRDGSRLQTLECGGCIRANLATRESGDSAEKKLLLSGKMASNVEAPERWYLALLGFAEHFRTSSPPKIRLCVHCLQAVFQFKPPQRIEARTHLQLGSVLYHHTKNSELARSHLEKAVRDARCRKERGCA